MKLLPCSSVPIDALVGALVIFESGASYYISSVGFDLDEHVVMVDLWEAETGDYHSSIPFSGLKDCSLQLNSSSLK